jgi:phospholipase C
MAATRREFLERTAYAAGLAGMAGPLPANSILAEAAAAAARGSGLPASRNVPIDDFVVLMMENRSFDHYFGWLADADGLQQQSFTDPAGNSVPTRHFSTLGTGGMEYKGCGHPDPGHGWYTRATWRRPCSACARSVRGPCGSTTRSPTTTPGPSAG